MSEWKTYTYKLGDLIECIIDNRGKSAPISISNYQPIIEINALGQREVNYDVIRKYVSKETYDTWFRAGHPKIGDILFSTVGTIGLTSLMNQDVGCIAQNIIALRVNDKLLNNLYLYYFLNNKTTKINLNNLNIGGVQPSIKLPHLLNMPISLPPLEEQKRIADILSAIDDKIELNRRINANLEQQAQALYKSWFVDFEPFGGKMPEDWKEGTLGEICTCYLGGTPSRTKSEYWSGNIPWINSGEVNKFRIIEGSEFITELGLKKSATKLLPKKTTVLAITGATLGQVSLLEIDSCANQSVIGILENKCIPYEFIYPLIKNDIDKIIRHQTGGAQQHINKNNIESHSVLIPDTKTMEQYKAIQAPVYNLIANKCFENLRLAQLRDTLLPKLMSGEITV